MKHARHTKQIASLKLGKIDFSICISEMMPVALFTSLFGTENGRRPPAGRQGRPKRPIMDCAPIIFLLLLLTGELPFVLKIGNHLDYQKNNFSKN
jgi:hypothetical protein